RIGLTARAATDGTAYPFISPKEPGRFARNDKLLGHPVTTATVPPELGPVPEYQPKFRGNGGGGSGAGRGHGGGSKKGGGKPKNGQRRNYRPNPNKPQHKKP
ncbi:MAG: DEAD/DEAH box helicase, partial [Chitinophaga sp.]